MLRLLLEKSELIDHQDNTIDHPSVASTLAITEGSIHQKE